MPERRVARARLALLSLFALLGIMMSSWLSRLPSIRDALELDERAIGVVLLIGAVGSLVTVPVAGALVARHGGRRVLDVATVGFAAALGLMSLGVFLASVPLVTIGIVLNSASFALNNVPVNVETAAVERAMGRTVIPQFHACFSIGALLGTLLGGAASWAGVPVVTQLLVSVAVLVVWRLVAVPHAVLETVRPHCDERTGAPGAGWRERRAARRSGGAFGAWRERRTLMLGLVVMAAAVSEGAANDWLALAVVDGFGRTEAVGALAFGVFVGSMTVLRIAGTSLIDRHGRVRVLRWSGSSAIVGLLVFGFAPGLPLALLGVALWGFGAALVIPIGIAAASDDPVRAAGRVTVVSAFSSVANLAAPPLLGLLAHQVGARHALTAIVLVLAVSLAVAGQAAPQRPRPPVAARPVLAPSGRVSDDGVSDDGVADAPAGAGREARRLAGARG